MYSFIIYFFIKYCKDKSLLFPTKTNFKWGLPLDFASSIHLYTFSNVSLLLKIIIIIFKNVKKIIKKTLLYHKQQRLLWLLYRIALLKIYSILNQPCIFKIRNRPEISFKSYFLIIKNNLLYPIYAVLIIYHPHLSI